MSMQGTGTGASKTKSTGGRHLPTTRKHPAADPVDTLSSQMAGVSLGEQLSDSKVHETLVDIEKMVEEEDKAAGELRRQGEQAGRIHNNLENTKTKLEEAQDDIKASTCCCFCCVGWCKCRKKNQPRHDVEFGESHPPPVVFNPGNPTTKREELAEAKAAAAHLKETLENENKMLDDTNAELRDTLALSDQVKTVAAQTDAQAKHAMGKDPKEINKSAKKK